MQRILCSLALVVGCGLVGCIQQAVLIELKPDGSGLIHLRVLFAKSMEKLAESNFDEAALSSEETTAAFRERAVQLGQGVEFVEAKLETKTTGWKGFTVTYRFEDVRKLQIPEVLGDFLDVAKPMKKSAASTSSASKSRSSNVEWSVSDRVYYFAYSEGETCQLSITPKSVGKLQAESGRDAFTEAGLATPAPSPRTIGPFDQLALAFLKPHAEGSRTSFLLSVDGKIDESNLSGGRPTDHSVFFFDADIAAMANSKHFGRLTSERWNIDRMLEEEVPGLSAIPSGTSGTVRFTPNAM